MKRGFTLIELLVTIVIISLVGGIGAFSYQNFFNVGKNRYYDNLESSILLAGSDYFLDHRENLPTENSFKEVPVSRLVDEKYIEPIKDSKGKTCTKGRVLAYRNNGKYFYEVCLECDEDEYSSSGKYCKEAANKAIQLSGKTKINNKDYDVTKSYNKVEYTNNENVLVTFNMPNSSIKVSRYDIKNTLTNYTISCSVESGNICTKEIEESGTYEVISYSENGEKIAETHINVKIAKSGPKYTVEEIQDKYMISASECSNNITKKAVKFKIVKDNINEEYKIIEYRIKKKNYDGTYTNDAYIQKNDLEEVTTELESGAYELEVAITGFADTTYATATTLKKYPFYISYIIDMKYDDDNTSVTHEVVKGQKYDYLSALPTKHNNLDIRWHYEENNYTKENRIIGTTAVTKNCNHELTGTMRTTISVENFTNYCKTPTPVFNGTKQTITKAASENVTFKNNEQTNAGAHKLKASIDDSKYIWNDETFDDKSFECSIDKYKAGLDISATSGTVSWNSEQTFTATPTTITACKGTLTAASANTSYVQITSGSSTANVAGGTATTIKWKGVLKTTGTKININYTPSDTNNCTSANQKQYTAAVTVATPTVSLSSKTGMVYSGSSQKANTATVSPDSKPTITYTYYTNSNCSQGATTSAPTNAGTYYVKASAAAVANKTAAANSGCVEHKITRAKTATTGSCANPTYNGSARTLASGGSYVTYSNNSKTDVGSSNYTVTVTADSNHLFSDGNATKTLSCNIERASISFPSCSDTNYNGKIQVLFSAHSSSSNVGYTNDAIKGKDVDDYSEYLTPDGNHKWSSGSSVTSKRKLTCDIVGKNRWVCTNCTDGCNASVSSQRWQYYNSSGNLVKNDWIHTGASWLNPDNDSNKDWFYADGDGYIVYGWREENGCWLYSNPNESSTMPGCRSGRAYISEKQTIDGSSYWFNKNGYCYSGSGCSSSCDK